MFAGDLNTRCYPIIAVISLYKLTLKEVIVKYPRKLLLIRTEVLASRNISNAARYENDPKTDP